YYPIQSYHSRKDRCRWQMKDQIIPDGLGPCAHPVTARYTSQGKAMGRRRESSYVCSKGLGISLDDHELRRPAWSKTVEHAAHGVVFLPDFYLRCRFTYRPWPKTRLQSAPC